MNKKIRLILTIIVLLPLMYAQTSFAQFVPNPTVSQSVGVDFNVVFSLNNDYVPSTQLLVEYTTDYSAYSVDPNGVSIPNENACSTQFGDPTWTPGTLVSGTGSGPYTFSLTDPSEPYFCVRITTDTIPSYTGNHQNPNANEVVPDPDGTFTPDGNTNQTGGNTNQTGGNTNQTGGNTNQTCPDGTTWNGTTCVPNTNTTPPTLNNPINVGSIQEFIAKLLDIALTIAIPIVALAIIYSGFLFVMARGNSEKLETAKQTLLYVIIGAALLLGAWVIANAIAGTIAQIRA